MRRSTTSRVIMPVTPIYGPAPLRVVSRTCESKKPATQTDVAKLAGVSQAAVSQAAVSRWTSGRGYVAPAVREQIIRAVAALDYRPHPLAQGLSSGQSTSVPGAGNHRHDVTVIVDGGEATGGTGHSRRPSA